MPSVILNPSPVLAKVAGALTITDNLSVGLVVPIPTFPALVIRILSVALVPNFNEPLDTVLTYKEASEESENACANKFPPFTFHSNVEYIDVELLSRSKALVADV